MNTTVAMLRRLIIALLMLLPVVGTAPALVAAEEVPVRGIQILAPAPDPTRAASPVLFKYSAQGNH